MASGAMSGALVSACVQPLDVLRTRMQADVAQGAFRSTLSTARLILSEVCGSAAVVVAAGRPARPATALRAWPHQALRRAAPGLAACRSGAPPAAPPPPPPEQRGIWGLWKGTQPTVIRLGLGAGLHFLFLESLKPMFELPQPDGSVRMTAVGAAATGGLSRALAACVSCPVTVVKTRMEYGGASPYAYTSTANGLATIVRTEGVRGLYRGLGPTVFSNAPFSALYYMFYTRLQARGGGRRRPCRRAPCTQRGSAAHSIRAQFCFSFYSSSRAARSTLLAHTPAAGQAQDWGAAEHGRELCVGHGGCGGGHAPHAARRRAAHAHAAGPGAGGRRRRRADV